MPGPHRSSRETAGRRLTACATGRWWVPALLVLLVNIAWTPAGAWAQEAAEVEETAALRSSLAEQLRERFEWVPLRNGWLLRSLTGDVERAVELSDGDLAVEGKAVSADELREWLGDQDAELLLQVLNLDEAERRLLFAPQQMADGQDQDEAVAEPEETRERESRRRRAGRSDTQVVVGSSLTVEEEETAEDVVVIGGALEVRGQVVGDAAAIGGAVTVSGEVTGDVVAVGGSVYLEPGAEVMGEVVSVGGRVEGKEDATVLGEVVEVPFGPDFHITGWPRWHFWTPGERHPQGFSPMSLMWKATWWLFALVMVVLLAFLVLLLARRPLERVERRVAAEPWMSALVGLAGAILFIPLVFLVVVILCVSIIGIPLLILVPFGLVAAVLVAFLGYCAVALRLGHVLEDRFGWSVKSPYLELLLGLALISVWCVLGSLLDLGWGPLSVIAAMFWLFGCLAHLATWVVGFGGALLTRFGTAEGWGREPQPVLPPGPGRAGSGGQYTEPPPPPSESFEAGETSVPESDETGWSDGEPKD